MSQPDDGMPGDEFQAALQIVGGHRWVRVGSRLLGMSERNVQAFAAGEKDVHPALADEVVGILRSQIAVIGADDSAMLRVLRRATSASLTS